MTEPITGFKARIDAAPTDASVRAAVYSAGVIQRRYERWTRYWYTQILADTRQSFEALDHIPSDAEVTQILARMDDLQERVLKRLLLNIWPQAQELVITEDQAKAIGLRMQVKARIPDEVDEDRLSETQRRLLAWLQANLQVSVDFVSMTTRDAIEQIRRQSNDVVDFYRNLQSTGAFTADRARMIAVTQTNQAVNSAIARAGEEAANGEEMVKTWRTSGRTNVRNTHRVMAGVTIPNDELYEVPNRHGGTDLMMWPGDSSHGADAGNVINCHCKSFPRLARYS